MFSTRFVRGKVFPQLYWQVGKRARPGSTRIFMLPGRVLSAHYSSALSASLHVERKKDEGRENTMLTDNVETHTPVLRDCLRRHPHAGQGQRGRKAKRARQVRIV